MAAAGFSETKVPLYQTALRHICFPVPFIFGVFIEV
jgi:hypothetical protein